MTQQINLYNPSLAPKAQLITGRSVLIGLVAVIGLSVLTWALVSADLARGAAREREQAARLLELQGAVSSLSQQLAARKPSAALEAEMARLEGLLRGRHSLIAALDRGALGDARGASDHLRALARQTPKGLWLTRVSIAGAGADIEVEGRTVDADLVPVYLRKLHSEPMLRGQRFESLTMSESAAATAGSGARFGSRVLQFRLAGDHREATSNGQEKTKRGTPR